MKSEDYHTSITADTSIDEAFDKIRRVSDWWTKSFRGSSQEVGDTFTVRFGETFVDFKIAEIVPGKRIVWLATDCHLSWIENTTEWTGTKIVWEVASRGKKAEVRMTHLGLRPDCECYDNCKPGWDFYVAKSLLKLLTENVGLPDGEGKKDVPPAR